MIEEVAEQTIDEVETSEITEEIIKIETAVEDIAEAGTIIQTKGIETKGPQEKKEEIGTNKTKIGMIEMIKMVETAEMIEMIEMTETKDHKEMIGIKRTKGTIVAVIGTIVAVIGTIVVTEGLLEKKEMLILIEGLGRMIEAISNKDPNIKVEKKELPSSLKSTISAQEIKTLT